MIGRIRDTQHYVTATEQRLGIHELGERDAEKDIETWASLLTWLEGDALPFPDEQTVLKKVSG